ncbi:MAG: hypothetical protein OXE57_11545 [Alphaproteobacteria bacterium]|nr:hypothetical protein [Alphaproteobacteria bacterium]
MEGRAMDVPDAERRRTANAALTGIIEEVCRHFAPSGARVEDCWEVREAGDGVSLRVFLTGPMQGSWTEAATGDRGDALDLVARLGGLDAAGALAEAERFLGRDEAGPDRNAGDAGGGQMALFGPLPESGGRKRPARRSRKGRNSGVSRRAAAAQQEPPAGDAIPPSGDEPADADEAGGGPQSSADAGAPEDGKETPAPADSGQDAGTGAGGSGLPASGPAGAGFTADDRQLLRRTAEDAAWTRSHMTVRSLDARAHERAKARGEKHGRGWLRSGLRAAAVLALAVLGPALGVMGESRFGIEELVSAYGAELDENARILPDGDGG